MKKSAILFSSCFTVLPCLVFYLSQLQRGLTSFLPGEDERKPRNMTSTAMLVPVLPIDVHPTLVYSAENMTDFVTDAFHGELCQKILRSTTEKKPAVVQVTFGCRDLFLESWFGTGNFIMAFYILHSTALAIGDVNVSITCHDAFQERGTLILPWLTGWFPAEPKEQNQTAAALPGKSVVQKCRKLQKRRDKLAAPLALRMDDIRFDLRRMAIALVGVPSSSSSGGGSHPARNFSTQTESSSRQYTLSVPATPILPHIQLDDAVIHFRCGDLMDSNNRRYGFLKFDSYARHISTEARTIGIVTEPFESTNTTQQRSFDSRPVTQERCRLVVHGLVDRLHERFPNATVTIHNQQDSTIASVYARMVMANQTISGTSTFSFFPAVATFGQAYVRRPRDMGSWLKDPASRVELFDDVDWLTTSQVQRMWGTNGSAVLEWFASPLSGG